MNVDDGLLRAWPLPAVEQDGDKEDRGRVLVVAGSREVPGAAVLAAEAALRAGAGKLVVATPASAWALVAAALPEARVISLPENSRGGVAASAVESLREVAARAAAVLAGPGMMDAEATALLVEALLPHCVRGTVVLDALGMEVLRRVDRFSQPVVMTPHPGEMAHLTRLHKDHVQDNARAVAESHAAAWGATLALKGSRTCVAGPDGRCWVHESQTPGLGTSGSGDVLAGIIAGLAARGAEPAQAAVWGVALHARAGERLARRQGTLGFLARELAGEVPALLEELSR